MAGFFLTAAAPVLSTAGDLHLRSGPRAPGAQLAPGDLALALGLPDRSGDAFLVACDRPLDAAARAAIELHGGRIVGYVPEDAYLVRMAPGRAAALGAAAPGLRVEPFRPVDRLAPALLGWLDSPREPHVASRTVRALGWRGESLEGLIARAARAVPDAVVLASAMPSSGAPRVSFDVPARSLARLLRHLALDPGVEFVGPEAAPHAMNGDASWVLQTGINADRKLFTSAGLTGVGQTIGLADMGLDWDSCAFRFAGGAATPPSSTQPPLASVTNGADKVLSYYLLTGADAGDTTAPGVAGHGTAVAGSIAGDNATAPATQVPRAAPFTFASPDPGDGMAPGAHLVVQDLGTSDGAFVQGIPQEALLLQAYNSRPSAASQPGARVHNSSYGLAPMDTGGGLETIYDGSSADIDDLLWRVRDLSAVWAAGNWGAIDPASGAPWNGRTSLSGLGAVAKNTITVGATGNPGAAGESIDRLLADSARGPSVEGLLKPDVVAPGHNLTALADVNPATCASSRRSGFGTSFAAAAVSGMAALVRQYFADGYWPSGLRLRSDPATQAENFNPSNALVKALLVNSARSLTGSNTGDLNTDPCPGAGCSAPSQGQGWGRVTVDDALFFLGDQRRLLFLADLWNGSDQPGQNSGRGAAMTAPFPARSAIETYWTHNYAFRLDGTTQGPLRCTLAWSDPAASPAAAKALVNDLDLEVHDPGVDGTVGNLDDLYFHGNQFHPDRPFSDAAQGGWDDSNPVENVWIEAPHAGVYNLRVFGRNVPGNGLIRVAALPAVTGAIDSARQGYSLVCSGDSTTLLSLPLVSATAQPDPPIGCVENNFVVDFSGTCSTCVAFEWDFGDGQKATGQNVSHPFTAAGSYLVSLTGRDGNGVEARQDQPFEVIVGNKADAGPVGNSFRMSWNPTAPVQTRILGFWSDIGVPAATTYQLWQFAAKADVESWKPVLGTQVPTSVPLIHGYKGVDFAPLGPALQLYQIRAANCIDEPGP